MFSRPSFVSVCMPVGVCEHHSTRFLFLSLAQQLSRSLSLAENEMSRFLLLEQTLRNERGATHSRMTSCE